MIKTKLTIKNEKHDEERAFYGLENAEVVSCVFKGAADGESALKECENIRVKDCVFSLRYPLWHTENFEVVGCSMDVNARAAVWYSGNANFKDCKLGGIKIFRECKNITVEGCDIKSFESAWKCQDMTFKDCTIESEYFLLDSKNVRLENVKMTGKYYMQYVENAEIIDCEIETKDALWHAKNTTVRNSRLKGEYLAWYSENLTLIDCEISGTQPLCYCKGLKLINCTMPDCDLAFELSEVDADIKGTILSVRSPLSGEIVADGVGVIVNDVKGVDLRGKIKLRNCG